MLNFSQHLRFSVKAVAKGVYIILLNLNSEISKRVLNFEQMFYITFKADDVHQCVHICVTFST